MVPSGDSSVARDLAILGAETNNNRYVSREREEALRESKGLHEMLKSRDAKCSYTGHTRTTYGYA